MKKPILSGIIIPGIIMLTGISCKKEIRMPAKENTALNNKVTQVQQVPIEELKAHFGRMLKISPDQISFDPKSDYFVVFNQNQINRSDLTSMYLHPVTAKIWGK